MIAVTGTRHGERCTSFMTGRRISFNPNLLGYLGRVTRLAPLTLCFVLLLVGQAVSTPANVDVHAGGAFGTTFSPADTSVDPGDTVTWTNDGGFHNVTFQD